MSIVAEHTSSKINLKGIIRETLRRINAIDAETLVARAHASEQRQLASQTGSIKSTQVHERMGSYLFSLLTVYLDSEVFFQHLVSPDTNGGRREYRVSAGSTRFDNEVLYNSILERDGRSYRGIAPEDGVPEVLLGKRIVSSQH